MNDRLRLAHALLTRLPLTVAGPVDRARLARAAVLFPVVGLTVGGIAALARLAADPLGAGFATLAALAAALVVTGALHEDGLGDTADALGARDRGRRLEVMRDPRIGTYGVLAVVVVLLGRLVLLSGLGVREAALALLAGHVLARGSVLPAAALVAPARAEGLGALLGRLPVGTAALGSLLALVLAGPALWALAPGALAALAAAPALALALAALWRRAFGGLTGDTHGATAQAVELATYACVVAAL